MPEWRGDDGEGRTLQGTRRIDGDSNFWQNLLLGALLVPATIGIGISTYYASKQQRSEKE